MANPFETLAPGLESPPRGAYAITPSNDNDLPTVVRAIWVGTAGDGTLKVTMLNGDVVTYPSVGVGRHSGFFKRVWATGTGVSNMIGEY